MKNQNKYYFPRADRKFLTPNEKWYRFQGILFGICLGFLISIVIVLGIL